MSPFYPFRGGVAERGQWHLFYRFFIAGLPKVDHKNVFYGFPDFTAKFCLPDLYMISNLIIFSPKLWRKSAYVQQSRMLTASGKWQFTKDGGVKVSWIFGPLSNADGKDGLLLQEPRAVLENKSAKGDGVGAILSTHSQAVTPPNYKRCWGWEDTVVLGWARRKRTMCKSAGKFDQTIIVIRKKYIICMSLRKDDMCNDSDGGSWGWSTTCATHAGVASALFRSIKDRLFPNFLKLWTKNLSRSSF